MKKVISRMMVCALGVLLLASCTISRQTISEKKFFQEIDDVNQSIELLGYHLSGTSSDVRNDLYVSDTWFSTETGYSTEMKNDYYWYDSYRFMDSTNNIVSYQIKYKGKGTQDAKGVYYVSDVSLVGCDCTNTKDYNAVCGPRGVTNRLNFVENDQVSTFRNDAGTVFLAIGGVLVVLVGLLLI